ncbi:MAG: hypothetical protein ACE37B_20940 [Ilumatobacter sp.]|uniref:hypothetical protein n=1 Tax=Ilumatobacter sp. TaxID=1967498 RepID=UPI00391D95EA
MTNDTTLLQQAAEFRRDASERVPGRLAPLIELRIRQLLGLDVDLDIDGAALPDDLTDAERLVIDLTEQFVIDVHGITDERFSMMSAFFSPGEQVAILFHLALTDGFVKLDGVHASQPSPEHDTMSTTR